MTGPAALAAGPVLLCARQGAVDTDLRGTCFVGISKMAQGGDVLTFLAMGMFGHETKSFGV